MRPPSPTILSYNPMTSLITMVSFLVSPLASVTCPPSSRYVFISFHFVFIGLELAIVGLLGWHRPALATGQAARQVRWCVCLDRCPRWWPGSNCHFSPLDLGSSWGPLRSPWLCDCLWTVDE